MKVLITRPRSQAAEFADKLRSAGFEPICFPVIEICPRKNNPELQAAMENLSKYEWIVFTSVNAVDAVALSGALSESRQDVGVKYAAIGPKTAEALRIQNIEPDFVPEEYVSEAVLRGLGDVTNKWILLPRAEIAREELPEAIVKANGIAHEIIVYRTLPAEIDLDGLEALRSGVDVITFTSASTVDNFLAIARTKQLDPLNLPNHPRCVCIGPVTEQAARRAGFQNILVAKEYTTDGLLDVIRKLEIL